MHRFDSEARIGQPADEGRLASIERMLGLPLPTSLREFLMEGDGLMDDHGSVVIWPVSDLGRFNQEFRTAETFRDLYMPFDYLLFFGADSDGDQFAFAIHADGRIHKNDIFGTMRLIPAHGILAVWSSSLSGD